MSDFSALDRCAQYLKVIADPDRLQILRCLQHGPRNVSDVSTFLGKRLANISHHLKILRQAGLVSRQKEGKFAHYALVPDFFLQPHVERAGCVLDLGCCRLQFTREFLSEARPAQSLPFRIALDGAAGEADSVPVRRVSEGIPR